MEAEQTCSVGRASQSEEDEKWRCAGGRKAAAEDDSGTVKNPLFLDGWLAFQEQKWGVKAQKQVVGRGGSGLPALHAVTYLDKSGKVTLPPMNPYLPIHFQPTPTTKLHKIQSQWFSLSSELAEECRRRGTRETISLSPEAVDIRAWQWAGLNTGLRYTIGVDFPYDIRQAAAHVRKQAEKAAILGYRCSRTDDMREVMECLRETERRKRFRHPLELSDLQRLRALLGDEHLRAYAVYAPNGEAVSAQLTLHCSGGRAYGWALGSKSAHLTAGVFQLLLLTTLEDLQQSGAAGMDFGGANIPAVAQTKMEWGARIIPYYTFESYGALPLAKWLRKWWKSRARRYRQQIGRKRAAAANPVDGGKTGRPGQG